MRRSAPASLVALVLAVLVVAAPSVAQMRRDMSVSPAVGEISTDAGRRGQDTFNVVNLSDDEISVIVSISPLEVDADGTYRAPASSDLPSAVAWGAVEPATFLLPRGNSRQVVATFDPPAGTPAGGYYAAIRVVGTVGSRNAVEVVHPVLISVAGDGILTRRGRVVSVDVPATSTLTTSIPVTLTLENSGNVHVTASGLVRVVDALSRTTATIPIGRTPILPGRTRRIVVDVNAPLIPWKYTVTAAIAFGRGSSAISLSATGYAFPWWGVVALVLVLLVALRVAVWIVRRRRRRRGARRMERGDALPAEIALERAELAEAEQQPAVSPSWEDVWEIEPVPRAREPKEAFDDSPFAPPGIEAAEELEAVEELEAAEEAAAIEAEEFEEFEAEAEGEELEEGGEFEEGAGVESGGEPETEGDTVLDLSAVFAGEDEAEVLAPDERAEELPPMEESAELPPIEQPPEGTPVRPAVFRELEALSEPEPLAQPEPEPEPEPEPTPEQEPEPEQERKPERATEPERAEQVAARSFPRTAAMRRVRIALGLVAAGDETKLEVGLEMLEALREHEDVRSGVADAYVTNREPALALALDAVGSERAPSALLESYGDAEGIVAGRIRAAIAAYPRDRLLAESEAVDRLPKKRLEELGLS